MTREELLDRAKEIVTKHRQSSYGTPEDSFGRIASFWSTYLGVTLSPADVANLMILLKVARSLNDLSKEDNYLDMAGYAACGAEVATKGKEQHDDAE